MPTEMLTKERRDESLPAPGPPIARQESPSADRNVVAGKEPEMYLTWRDLAGTAVAALVVLAYVANTQDWWYLGGNRWAAVTMVAIGAIGCSLGARMDGARPTLLIVLLGLVGMATLTLAVLAIVTAAQWTLLALAILVVALWAGATLRHAATSPPRLAAP